jgi:hypothetical protein
MPLSALLVAAARRAGRDAEQRTLRELTEEDAKMRGRTRDAAYSYPPGAEGKLGGGGPEWRGERFPSDQEREPFRGRVLPSPPTIDEPFPSFGPQERPVGPINMPFRYSSGGERDRGRDVRSRAARFGRDEGGYVQPVRAGEPGDPSRQGLGGWEREDFDTEDDVNLADEPVGFMERHSGEPEDFHISHDPTTGDCAIWQRGRDEPVGFIRPPPGLSARDYRFAKDRRSGRIAILRRRQRDRMRRLQHEAADILHRPTRDAAHREHLALANLNQVNAEFWRRPQSPSDFWNRRR